MTLRSQADYLHEFDLRVEQRLGDIECAKTAQAEGGVSTFSSSSLCIGVAVGMTLCKYLLLSR